MPTPLILTQLPSKLVESSLYRGYFSCEEDGAQLLTDTVQSAYSYMTHRLLMKRMLQIGLESPWVTPGSPCIFSIQDPFDLLVAAAKSSDESDYALLWLMKLTSRLLVISERHNLSESCFITGSDQLGAQLVRFGDTRSSPQTPRRSIGKSDHY